ncbi:hypothetical protein BD626DRAFT_508173 [Schizophyllum amplum]|uniref:Cytochrome b561 domain-containing protein n=1 Tax=Schizophyllum amplum TaxID=97359 RepID=A0A550C3M5_9AGAR|nr:hypothetical protein BD626DRAFT_508173 [Auriculariopsis ampla]
MACSVVHELLAFFIWPAELRELSSRLALNHHRSKVTLLSSDPNGADGGERSVSPAAQQGEARKGDDFAGMAALCLVIITILAVLFNHPLSAGWFAWHPPLEAIGVVAMVYGAMILQPTATPQTKAAGLAKHQLLILSVGFPASLLGTLAVAYNKSAKGKHHFTSWHAKIGLLCTLWLVVQVALGGASVWFDGRAFGGGLKAKRVWKYHRISGYILFILLMATVHLGGQWSGWGSRNVSPVFRAVAYSLTPIVLIAALAIRTRTSKMGL